MQIIKNEGRYRVYGENIEVYDNLDPDFYQFMVDENGPFLVRTSRPTISDKVYGSDQSKISKCINTYRAFNRSLGIMLSGNKGNGKTLFAKQLCLKMINDGYPVINVNHYHPSLPTFMTQISQECVFLFDEFEKMFPHTENHGSDQNEMLSTFDGINMSKKMFIITCNSVSNLSQYIYNRPGRFHYSFTFTEPKYDDIHEYLEDNINPIKCIETVDDISLFAYINGLNYDCLRSLAFELNNGYSLVETFDDLNMGYTDTRQGTLTLVFDNGEQLYSVFAFTPFRNEFCSCDIRSKKAWFDLGVIRFRIDKLKYSQENDLYLSTDDITIDWARVSSTDNQVQKESVIHYRNLPLTRVLVKIDKSEKINPLRMYDDISNGNAVEELLTLEDSLVNKDGQCKRYATEQVMKINGGKSVGFMPITLQL